MALGTIVSFDELRGYGFIAPVNGGADVFVHANDFGDTRHLVRPGIRVRYEVAETDRGLKAATVAIEQPAAPGATATPGAPATVDDGECDVLAVRDFQNAVTEALLENVPTLTAAQIVATRRALLAMARGYGWVED
jgi:cold shock CspA family protein